MFMKPDSFIHVAMTSVMLFAGACTFDESGTSGSVDRSDLVAEPEGDVDEPVDVAGPCKIGDAVIGGLPSGSQACKDGKAFDKAVKTMAKPMHAKQLDYLVENDSQIYATFNSPGIGNNFSMQLNVTGGSYDLGYYDNTSGDLIYRNSTDYGETVNAPYFAALSIKQNHGLVNSMAEALAKRMRNTPARILGEGTVENGVPKCLGYCAERVCSLPFLFGKAISASRIPAIQSVGAQAIGVDLWRACVGQGPIIASGTYCCQSVGMQNGQGVIQNSTNCRAVEGAAGKNDCGMGHVLNDNVKGSTVECVGSNESLVPNGAGNQQNLKNCKQDKPEKPAD
jgi:hypothetical protein